VFLLDPTKAPTTLAKLQNPVKTSFDAINDDLKETYSGLNKYTKALDKVNYIGPKSHPFPDIHNINVSISYLKIDHCQALNMMHYHPSLISSIER